MSGHQPAPDEENHQDYHGGVLVKARARKQGSDAELEHEELQGKRVRERLPAHELQNVQHGPQEEEDHRETVEAAPESLVVVEDPEKEERKRRHGKEVKQQIIGYPGKVEADEVAEETQEHAETPIYNAPKAVYKGYSLFNFYKLTLFVGFGGLNAFWRRILPRKTPSNGSLRDFNVFWREKSSDRVVKGLHSPARSRATATTSRSAAERRVPKALARALALSSEAWEGEWRRSKPDWRALCTSSRERRSRHSSAALGGIRYSLPGWNEKSKQLRMALESSK